MLVNFGQASLIGKARAQPDKVKQVIGKVKTDGLMPMLEAVFNKLDQPLPLGYCNVGVVIGVGDDVTGFAVGDRVISNGKHAEIVSVPKNLCAIIPDKVSDEDAAFVLIGSIALQGIRLVAPTLGETVVVTGLGLIGLVAVQLLRAHGCRVLGLDYDERKLELAKSFGAETVSLASGEDPVAAARAFSRARGVDAVLITASTPSNEPVHHAALMCRKRGRIVLVGVTGLELSRADFYEKELSFQVSCSYGPGRYDPAYEEQGADYPVGFVRWTEQRNFEAVLDMMQSGRLQMAPLVSHRFLISDAEKAYQLISDEAQALGILLTYPATRERTEAEIRNRSVSVQSRPVSRTGQALSLGFIGSGNYAGAVLIPAFKATGASLRVVASSAGVTGAHAARKFGFESTTTDIDVVLGDPKVDAVVIATRHDTHASLVVSALDAGKHVFVEKPLAVNEAQLGQIQAAHERHPDLVLTVGFNRRFAPHVQRIHALLASVTEPKVFLMTVNAGAIPPEHWTQDPRQGGGRIIGEACHFIDLLRYLAAGSIVDFQATCIGSAPAIVTRDDKTSITLRFADGSMGTILYLANGDRSFPKERLEVFAAGRILQLDNFRRMRGFGWPGFSQMNLWRQDKGQRELAAAFVKAVSSGSPPPIATEELFEVGRVTIQIAATLR